MFDTPQEAALKAENARLRAENEWLRKAVEHPGRTVTAYAVEDTVSVRDIKPDFRLPRVSGIEGNLQNDGRWAVIAWQERIDRSRLEVGYYTDGYRTKHIDDMTFVNHILPKMHQKFIGALSDIFVKEMRR